MAMEKKYLTVNVGSTSKRYTLYFGNKEIFDIKIENNASYQIINLLKSKNLIKDNKELAGIGVRIVSPGIYFLKNRIIDRNYEKKLKNSLHMAPLHIKPTILEIKNLKKQFPKTPLIGVSDSEFHSTMPEVAKFYAIPKSYSHKFQIYRYGYHGIALKSVIEKIKSNNKIPSRIIICHLGGGCSITAVKDSKSIETSMGFTPLEGLAMTTRSGNIDFSAAIYLGKSLGLNTAELEKFLNTECGLYGLSESSSDMRKLLKQVISGNKKAKAAIDHFIHNIKKFIGSYFALLDGLDLIIFSGAIGENSSKIRSKICEHLSSLGLILEEKKNLNYNGRDGFIHSKNSKVKIAIVKANEKEIILKEIIRLIEITI